MYILPLQIGRIVYLTSHARNNSQCFSVDFAKTVEYRKSFLLFSPRTTIDWNNLNEEAVTIQTVEHLKGHISRYPKVTKCSPLSH